MINITKEDVGRWVWGVGAQGPFQIIEWRENEPKVKVDVGIDDGRWYYSCGEGCIDHRALDLVEFAEND